MADIGASLVEFGADPRVLHLLDSDGPELLPYATLTAARRSHHPTLGVVEAVYEWQRTPLVFLVDADSLEDDGQLHRVRRLLAMRGDAPYVGVVAPGSLDVYRVALDRKSLQQARVRWEDGEDVARSAVFARLGNVRPQAAVTSRNWVANVVLTLLSGSATRLICLGSSDEDAISLVGRALFTRFLADRGLLPSRMLDSSAAACLFDTPEMARETSEWLDAKFNGDLLPLSPHVFERLSESAYSVLGNILRKAPDGQLFLGWEEKWCNLDFAHIPVGVLSQAYELYLRKHAPAKQRREGGYFTPKPIAELMVRASFSALERRDAVASAKVLDPAVGAGIFLLAAFRELVAARWQADGKRPDTQILRGILYNQLVGFDVNESALRFAALGLYLLSIELDPNPKPIEKLRFKDLRGTVLHRVKAQDEEEGKGLGSLGPLVGDEHSGEYDVVVGNPPWSSGTKLPNWDVVRATVARIAADRRAVNVAPPLPNEGLDLPFVWRAMEWAKPDGQIAFALHARLLFQQGDGMPIARRALFEAVDVTSVINGVELRKTKVWPQITAPFCVLFATNRRPGADAGFRFVSPRLERSLNGAGGMRIDTLNSGIVSSRQLGETPEILKILSRGSKADLGIVERIRAQGHPTLFDFWREKVGGEYRGRLRQSGSGYQTLKRSSRVRRHGDGLPGADARYLHNLPEIAVGPLDVLIDAESLGTFSHDRIHDPRSRDFFAGPLTVVHKSPVATEGRIGVGVCDEDVVFNETFYGYSAAGHRDSATLVRYLTLVLGSKLVVWLALVTSGEFGFEREVIEKATLDRIPLPDFDELDPHQRRAIGSLVDGLQSKDASWDDVDRWVARLYGLGKRDLQVIYDTLEFSLPFARNTHRAQDAPTLCERERFCMVLRDELRPWCERFGSTIAVDQIPPLAMSPWQAVAVRKVLAEPAETVSASDWAELLRAADEVAASEILVRSGPDGLLIGRLAQRRYWSETQARLLAERIAWSHIELLKVHADE